MNIALVFQGNRASTLTEPLDAVGQDYDVSPSNLMPYDVMIVDSPNPQILKYQLMTPGKVVLRLRGNLWKERKQNGTRWTQEITDRIILPRVDGLLAPDQRLEAFWHNRIGRTSSIPLGLPIDSTEWPSKDHSKEELELVTLTNADYAEKIEPLLEYAPLVNELLEENGGTWRICGDGEYSTYLEDTGKFSHIEYCGFVDPKPMLERSNVMLHLSNFDIEHPNAVLEGAASNLPVVTNGFAGFKDSGLVTQCEDDDALRTALERLQQPAKRQCIARQQQEYLCSKHTPKRIGRQLTQFLRALEIQEKL
jgi:glycosyltransferase involved in cell wall biosynthesis